MILFVCILLQLIGQAALADPPLSAALAAECKLNQQFADEVIPSDEVEGDYWLNLLDDNTALFSAHAGVSGKYQGFDFKKKEPILLTEGLDPFPAPDGRRIYIHPNPIRFYEFDTIRDKIKNEGIDQKTLNTLDLSSASVEPNSKIIKSGNVDDGPVAQDNDPTIQGYYESMGTLKRVQNDHENYSDYRVLTGQGEGAIKDYRITFGPSDKILKIKELTPIGIKLCPNLRNSAANQLDFDTPILSPKGDEFAVVNRKTHSTVVIGFDPKTGICETKFDLGFETGKLHFSPDGSKIAFHANGITNQNQVLTHSNVPRPYLYDRKTKQLTALSVGDFGDNAQGTFPAFRKDGKIVYQRSSYNPITYKNSRAWVIVDPKKLNSITLDEAAACVSPAAQNLNSLASLWKSVCASLKRDSKNEALNWALTVDPKVCEAFVKKHYAEFQAATKASASVSHGSNSSEGVSEAALMRACPTKKIALMGPSTLTPGVTQTYPRLLAQRCMVCHTENSPHGYIPFNDPEAMRKMSAIGNSAKPGQAYFGKTFVQQISDILEKNKNVDDPGAGIPRVPADGERLGENEVSEIVDWVTRGNAGKYAPKP